MDESQFKSYDQSSVIPIFAGQVVLITSNRSRRWIVPKGLVEPDLTPQESAAQEALEEAGLLGSVSQEPVGFYEYEKWNGICHVTVYSMSVTEVLDDWDEKGWRDRALVSPSDALEWIEDPVLNGVVSKFLDQTGLLAD